MSNTLAPEELERYARHIVLPEIGGAGQQKLKAARVLVVGAGGLGSPLIQYLAAAGVGTLGVVDEDRVSLSNLQRQILFTTGEVGEPKVEAAARAVAALNPDVEAIAFNLRLDRDNAEEILEGFDLVADGTDNFATRYAVAEVCERAGKTLVTAAVGRFDASLSVIKPHEADPQGRHYPTYAETFGEKPSDGMLPTCEEAGIIGALTGVAGSLQALEVIKEITGAGETLAGRILLYDGLSTKFEIIDCMG